VLTTKEPSLLASHPFLNLEEAAALVGLKPPTLRRAIRIGQLVYAKPGRAYVVRLSDVTRWLEDQLRQGGVKIAKKAAGR
jgi:excisionase family DNA binding protein